MSTIGDVIRIKRLTRRLTQAQLADEVGVSTASVIAWEKGRNNPRIEVLTKLMEVLGFAWEEIQEPGCEK